MIMPSVLKQAFYVSAALFLHTQHRVPASHLTTAAVDAALGVLFVVAFFRLCARNLCL